MTTEAARAAAMAAAQDIVLEVDNYGLKVRLQFVSKKIMQHFTPLLAAKDAEINALRNACESLRQNGNSLYDQLAERDKRIAELAGPQLTAGAANPKPA